ncbi:MAG: SEC-C domain-containing protein [Candidatus Omnitrophica bacterium]|nr:SEC-C domain-containing protein [Candidatus Omnitrophota bacterium]
MAKKLNEVCSCGSGKKYGECCGKNEPCSCGSGKKASECCYKSKAAGKGCC